MAELTISQKGGRRKVAPPRIDFTPLVDLGFLLITFFMFTTTLANPKSMELNMPSDEPSPNPTSYPAESTITIIPVSNHRFVYYKGLMPAEQDFKVCDGTAVRNVLMQSKRAAADLPTSLSAAAHKLHVIIKPSVTSTYGDMVHILDEMNITAVPYYALVDISADEQKVAAEKFH